MIKAIIFDIDNTLYSYDDAHVFGWEALCDYAKTNLNMDRDVFAEKVKQTAAVIKERLDADCAALHDRTLRTV